MGIVLDKKINIGGNLERVISDKNTLTKAMIIPTNKELCLVNNIYSFLNKSKILFVPALNFRAKNKKRSVMCFIVKNEYLGDKDINIAVIGAGGIGKIN